jgi:hypothetical protein
MKLTRERWLLKCSQMLRDGVFKRSGNKLNLKKVRVTCGFPSKGGAKIKNKTIGQCFPSTRSGKKLNEIFIHPMLEDGVKVVGTLAHELVHAELDCRYGHGKEFRKIAVGIGLTGKMTATVETPEFKEEVKKIIKKIGKYPHATLDTSMIKKQGTRMIKAVCTHSDLIEPVGEPEYIVRLSRTQAMRGLPLCPVCYEISCGDEAIYMQFGD